ncbi:dapper homolog 3-like [Pogoniulus pusillus]|uniref:dapper homolog 3-like n=1 Tax=Pogoniulus pusillus TaxID=488313 RepID=UPI0030B99F09
MPGQGRGEAAGGQEAGWGRGDRGWDDPRALPGRLPSLPPSLSASLPGRPHTPPFRAAWPVRPPDTPSPPGGRCQAPPPHSRHSISPQFHAGHPSASGGSAERPHPAPRLLTAGCWEREAPGWGVGRWGWEGCVVVPRGESPRVGKWKSKGRGRVAAAASVSYPPVPALGPSLAASAVWSRGTLRRCLAGLGPAGSAPAAPRRAAGPTQRGGAGPGRDAPPRRSWGV